jgi:hypothetical protein
MSLDLGLLGPAWVPDSSPDLRQLDDDTEKPTRITDEPTPSSVTTGDTAAILSAQREGTPKPPPRRAAIAIGLAGLVAGGVLAVVTVGSEPEAELTTPRVEHVGAAPAPSAANAAQTTETNPEPSPPLLGGPAKEGEPTPTPAAEVPGTTVRQPPSHPGTVPTLAAKPEDGPSDTSPYDEADSAEAADTNTTAEPTSEPGPPAAAGTPDAGLPSDFLPPEL